MVILKVISVVILMVIMMVILTVILMLILKEVTLRGQQQQKCEKTGHLHIVNSHSPSQEL